MSGNLLFSVGYEKSFGLKNCLILGKYKNFFLGWKKIFEQEFLCLSASGRTLSTTQIFSNTNYFIPTPVISISSKKWALTPHKKITFSIKDFFSKCDQIRPIDYLGNKNQVLFRLYREYQFEITCESYRKASILFFNEFMLK